MVVVNEWMNGLLVMEFSLCAAERGITLHRNNVFIKRVNISIFVVNRSLDRVVIINRFHIQLILLFVELERSFYFFWISLVLLWLWNHLGIKLIQHLSFTLS